jgi:hypothetical protein
LLYLDNIESAGTHRGSSESLRFAILHVSFLEGEMLLEEVVQSGRFASSIAVFAAAVPEEKHASLELNHLSVLPGLPAKRTHSNNAK